MLRKFFITVAVIVNLSNGYKISTPNAVGGSFSGSSASSSASAYSSSSSSSFSGSFIGDLSGNEVNNLLGKLKGANAGFASAGASAHAVADSAAERASVSGSGAHLGTSGCSNENSGCDGKSTLTGTLPHANYELGDHKVQGNSKSAASYSAGTCLGCRGPFPGPSGSIHDYKLASPAQNTAAAQVPAIVPAANPSTLSSNDIYSSKPASVGVPVHSVSYGGGSAYYGSIGTNKDFIQTLPGSPGSIYSSKPVSHKVESGSSYNAGQNYAPSYSGIVGTPSIPIIGPACSYTPGSPHKECGPSGNIGSSSVAVSAPAPGTFPGPTGSIYDSKPAHLTPLQHGPETGNIHSVQVDSVAAAQAGSQIGGFGPGDQFPEVESTPGIYYIIKEKTPPLSHDLQAPYAHSPSISAQVPCGTTGCQNIDPVATPFNCNGADCGNVETAPEILLGPGTGDLPIEKPNTSFGSQGSYGTSTSAYKEVTSAKFPGPTESIHAYKPTHNVVLGGASNVAQAGAVSYSESGKFPGPVGSIHDSKPAPNVAVSGGLPATPHIDSPSRTEPGKFPGPVGSIHDTKPIHNVVVSGAGNVAQAGAQAGAVSYSESGKFPGPVGSIYDSKPVPNAIVSGGLPATPHIDAPSRTEPGKFPGPVGSIYDNKPIVGGVHADSAATSGTQSTLTPVKYPTSNFPGGSGSIHESKPASNAAGGAAYSGSTISNQDKIIFDYPSSGSGVPCFSGSCGGSDSGYATGQVTVQKNDGSLVSGDDDYKLAGYIGCTGTSCNNAGQKSSPFGSYKNDASLISGNADLGGFIGCTGNSCKNAGQKSGCLGGCISKNAPSLVAEGGQSGSGLVSGHQSVGSAGSTFGTNQASSQDISTVDSKSNQNVFSESVAGSYSGAQLGSEGKHAFAGSDSFASGSGGTTHFGPGSSAHAGSAAYSKAGAFSGSSSGSYASASAHASSFASSY